MDAIQQYGLTITLHDQRFGATPTAVSSASDLSRSFDIVLLCVRAWAVESSLKAIPGLMNTGGTLVTLQNGFGTEEIVSHRVPGLRHVAGSLTLSADSEAPNQVTSGSNSGGIAFAPVSGNVGPVVECFDRAGIPTRTFEDYRSMKWSKLLLNQMANGIPAILDWTPGQLYRHGAAFQVELAMLRETIRVIEADGARLVSLPGFPVPLLRWVLQLPAGIARRLLLRRVEGGRGSKLPSMLLDLRAGRSELEADWLYGAVAKVGERAGIPALVNQRINTILNGIATNSDLRETVRDRPDWLIRNVQLASPQQN
jgi:2-dehydropantoate 2-reductase